ncbi:MAG: hypothetical protein JW891_09465 [Candidatus Lokiarchaeota archaeon]|nr:hypothetical protein [Candidatus Lokiarchaeota archaeon]
MTEIILEHEPLVIDLIQEYLDQNRYFNKQKIVSFLSYRLKESSVDISREGIRYILKTLAEKKYIMEGSKLIREEVLSNKNREKIYRYIKNNPGTNFNGIYKTLDLNIPVVEWHLSVLMKFGCVVKVKYGNQDAYFHISIKPKNYAFYHMLSKKKSRRVIKYLIENSDGTTKNQIANALKMHPNTLKKILEKLINYNLLHINKVSNKTLYFLNEKKFQLLNLSYE